MRKTIAYLSILLALVSCQKQDLDCQDPIQVSAYASRLVTKAGPGDPNFRLAIRYDSNVYMATSTMVKDGDYWKASSRLYYWPYDISSTKPMQFFGVYCIDSQNTPPDRTFSTGTLSIADLSGTEDIYSSYSNVESKPTGGILQLQFKHILAGMYFTVCSDNANMEYAIVSMNLTAVDDADFDIKNETWTLSETSSKNYPVTDFPTSVTTEASEIFGKNMLIPQTGLLLTVEYTVTDALDYTVSYTGNRAKTVILDNTTRQGYVTSYNLTLCSDKISFETIFIPWEASAIEDFTATFDPLPSDESHWDNEKNLDATLDILTNEDSDWEDDRFTSTIGSINSHDEDWN